MRAIAALSVLLAASPAQGLRRARRGVFIHPSAELNPPEHMELNVTDHEAEAWLAGGAELVTAMAAADAAGARDTNWPRSAPVMTPEWAPMAGVLVRYPFGIPTELVADFSRHSSVFCVTTNENGARSAMQNAGADMGKVTFINAATDSYWTRDWGPWWVNDGELGIADFTYNRGRARDNAVNRVIAEQLGVPIRQSGLTLTGGNNMVDGTGRAAKDEHVYDDNSGKSNAEVDRIYTENYGAEFYAVPDPTGTYIRHIDTWSKYLDESTILISAVPRSNSRYNQYEAAAAAFAQRVNGRGEAYRVLRVNTGGSEPYVNSLIVNDRVYVPLTGNSLDDEAISVYESALPDKTIVGVFATGQIRWQATDALHCRTRGIPSGAVQPTPAPVPTPAPPPGTWVIAGTGCEADGNCIQSINHPSSYGNSEQCSVTIAGSISLATAAFSTESSYDVLTIGGRQYSGTSGPPSGSYSGTISWASDFSVTNSGWRLCSTS